MRRPYKRRVPVVITADHSWFDVFAARQIARVQRTTDAIIQASLKLERARLSDVLQGIDP